MAVGRFQVMATLQAARAFVLGLPLASAKSWGLNRAIFYAAAKRGLLGHRAINGKQVTVPTEKPQEKDLAGIRASFGKYEMGDDYAYSVRIGGDPYFVIGDEVQTAERFDKQVEARFGATFSEAWGEALKICKGVDRSILLSQRQFYETLYKPRRDELAKKWTEMVGTGKASLSQRTSRAPGRK
jgi:hypothetical protein